MEPKGIGALQIAFEQLKVRLAQEGLFDGSRKRPLPMLPRGLGIVTSPTGAVIRDMLQIFAGVSPIFTSVSIPSASRGMEPQRRSPRGLRC